jgi:hypothetical protein
LILGYLTPATFFLTSPTFSVRARNLYTKSGDVCCKTRLNESFSFMTRLSKEENAT